MSLTGLVLFMILLHGCSVFEQASQIKNFSRCDFRLESIEQLKLGGVNIQGKNGISDLGVIEADYRRDHSFRIPGPTCRMS